MEPIELLIVQDLQAALRQVSTAAGYHFDLAGMAVKLDPNHAVEVIKDPNGPRPFVLIEVGRDSWEFDPALRAKVTLPVTVHWVSESLEPDDEARMRMFFRGCADVERAIAQDIQRGGRAIDTRIVGRIFDLAVDGQQVWARVDTRITLRRTYGQPDA